MAINVYQCRNLTYWPRYIFLDSLREKGIPYSVRWNKKDGYQFVVNRNKGASYDKR
jgi:hypothetical protein